LGNSLDRIARAREQIAAVTELTVFMRSYDSLLWAMQRSIEDKLNKIAQFKATVVSIIETPIQRYRVLKTAIRQEKTMYNRCSIFLVEHHWHLVFDWHYIWDKGKDIR